jgi:hypothetical protein
MTESEWLACTNPWAMLEHLRASGTGSERKARLFAAAVCRRVWPLITGEPVRRAVEVAERYADGLASRAALGAARRGLQRAARLTPWGRALGHQVANRSGWEAARMASLSATLVATAGEPQAGADELPLVTALMERVCQLVEAGRAKIRTQCPLVSDVFGNPFLAPPPLNPAWLSWKDGTVPTLAQAVYDQRELPSGALDGARLAVLADALEEAGCDQADLLAHLRGPGPHVRGCWAVDLLLGKS